MREWPFGLDGADGHGQAHFLVVEFLGQDGWDVDRLKHWLPRHLVDRIREVYFDP